MITNIGGKGNLSEILRHKTTLIYRDGGSHLKRREAHIFKVLAMGETLSHTCSLLSLAFTKDLPPYSLSLSPPFSLPLVLSTHTPHIS